MKRIIITNWKIESLFRITLFTVVGHLFIPFFTMAQPDSSYEINELKGLFKTHEHVTPRYSSVKEKPKNEIEFMMASGFNIYKAFFSSQDNPSCVFYPSCSEYTVQALQYNGLFVGTLQSFDRLSRCHRLVKENQYYFNPTKQRFHDPIR